MKMSVMQLSARLTAGVLLLSSTAALAQSSAFTAIAGDKTPNDMEDHFVSMHKQLENTNHVINELLGTIQDNDLADPISADGFDLKATSVSMLDAGMISDIVTWTAAATIIEDKGFVAYLEQAKTNLSKLDRDLTTIGKRLVAWSALKKDERISAVADNTDTNILIDMAVLQTKTDTFKNFAMAGVLVFAQMAYIDNSTDAPFMTDTVATEQSQTADA